MKFRIKSSKTSVHWELIDPDNELFISGVELDDWIKALQDIELFAKQAEHFPIVCNGHLLSGEHPLKLNSFSLMFKLYKKSTIWYWDLCGPGREDPYANSSVIHPGKKFKSLNSVLRSAMNFRTEIAFAPIYDSGDIEVNAIKFTADFARTRGIEDPHPSSRVKYC
ncbi:hypothetical protein QOM18_01765 [Serratia marcescens]|uniref:hypothetical protein n=1 Tax=Serratia marcescens TaxID=615 RepID=UPI0024C4D756|nr:hypothetical protein [Serratia marcescens]MDK1707038.1 hypothetical protein [Serratia marcescens]